MADLTQAEIVKRARDAGLENPRIIPRKSQAGPVHTQIIFGPFASRMNVTIAERPDRMPESALLTALAAAAEAQKARAA